MNIIPFPTFADVKSAYDNPEYQQALEHRLKGADYRVFIVNCIDG
jgi:uncharacterized protein (DUF1330 family)